MKIEKVATRTEFPDDYITRISETGNVSELVMMKRKNCMATIQKLNKESYCILSTGEVKDYEHYETRADDTKGVRATLDRLRGIINCNVTEAQNSKFITLTYAENMTDREKLYIDRKNYWRRFKAYCKQKGITTPEYISVLEPQGRGAFHLHEILIWNTKAPYIPNEEIWRCWSPDGIMNDKDYTKTKAITDCDNIGAYFSAYLADMPIEEYQKLLPDNAIVPESDILDKEFKDDDETIKKKKFVKGGRLHLYPTGVQIYRKSKGIVMPEYEYTTYKKAKEKVSGATETFSQTFVISDDVRDFTNEITKVYYNSKRANSITKE